MSAPQYFLPKDFIATAEGLAFAVVASAPEAGRVVCSLRYVRAAKAWRKIATDAANALLTSRFPQYYRYSPAKDTWIHAVPAEAIVKHYRPRQILQALLNSASLDPIQQDLADLCALYRQAGLPLSQLGITGSLLLGAQNSASDLDVVVYERECFHQTRAVTQKLMASGTLQPLNAEIWRQTYARRGCALSLEEYIWHESRKFNKACINGRKFDLSLVTETTPEDEVTYRKLGMIELQAQVTDARCAFDFPSRLLLAHPEIRECVSYTATYAGQAHSGEWIAVRGVLEAAGNRSRRVLVGTSREAPDEYIKVLPQHE